MNNISHNLPFIPLSSRGWAVLCCCQPVVSACRPPCTPDTPCGGAWCVPRTTSYGAVSRSRPAQTRTQNATWPRQMKSTAKIHSQGKNDSLCFLHIYTCSAEFPQKFDCILHRKHSMYDSITHKQQSPALYTPLQVTIQQPSALRSKKWPKIL